MHGENEVFFFSLRGIFWLFTSTPRESMTKWKWSSELVKALHRVVFGTFPIAKSWNRDLLQMTYERAPRLLDYKSLQLETENLLWVYYKFPGLGY